MFLLSSQDLLSEYKGFVEASNSVTLICAYIKIDELKTINISKKITRIIVRWDIQDLLFGSSDLSLFEYCKENDITLFRNHRLHMKVLWNNFDRIIFGSSNITKRGIGSFVDSNFEFNKIDDSLDFNARLYLQSVIAKSDLVDDVFFQKMSEFIDKNKMEISMDDFDFHEYQESEYQPGFLISDLPQIESPIMFYECFLKRERLSELDEVKLIHDMVLFNISVDCSLDLLLERLKFSFNNHPFIVEFKGAVKRNNGNRPDRAGSMNFGAVRLWFAENTTTVPTPRPFELSDYIQVLYTWICYFDDEFSWSVPGGHSQVIQYHAK